VGYLCAAFSLRLLCGGRVYVCMYVAAEVTPPQKETPCASVWFQTARAPRFVAGPSPLEPKQPLYALRSFEELLEASCAAVLNLRCLWRATVKRVQCMITCSAV